MALSGGGARCGRRSFEIESSPVQSSPVPRGLGSGGPFWFTWPGWFSLTPYWPGFLMASRCRVQSALHWASQSQADSRGPCHFTWPGWVLTGFSLWPGSGWFSLGQAGSHMARLGFSLARLTLMARPLHWGQAWFLTGARLTLMARLTSHIFSWPGWFLILSSHLACHPPGGQAGTFSLPVGQAGSHWARLTLN